MNDSVKVHPMADLPQTRSPSLKSIISGQAELSKNITKKLEASCFRKFIDQWQMVLVILIPLTGMLVLSSLALKQAVATKEVTTNSIGSVEVIELYAELVKMLQRERGLSAMYLSSTQLDPDILDNVRFDTEVKLSQITYPSEGLMLNGLRYKDKTDFKEYLTVLRRNVTYRHVEIRVHLQLYTEINEVLVRYGIQILELPKASTLHNVMVAYNYLLKWSDVIGIQRALGSTFFTNCAMSFNNEKYYLVLHGEAYAHQGTAIMYGQGIQQMFTESIRSNDNFNTFYNQIYNKFMTEISVELCENMTTSELLETSQIWFHNMTVFIDEVFRIRNEISSSMKKTLAELISEVTSVYTAYISLQIFSVTASFGLSMWYFSCLSKMNNKISKFALKVEERTKELLKEKRLTEKLLFRMLPRDVAYTLKTTGKSPASEFSEASIFFSDVVGFTAIGSRCSPMQIIDFLNEMYSFFDDIIDKYDVYKVETIGDAYMVVSGVPTPNGQAHAYHISKMAVDIRDEMIQFTIPCLKNQTILIRMGIHSGPVVAGVVGRKMPRYCLFGDTVNTASRMESTGEGGRIQISEKTHHILDKDVFVTTERGAIKIKGKGDMITYWLEDYISKHGIKIKQTHGSLNWKRTSGKIINGIGNGSKNNSGQDGMHINV